MREKLEAADPSPAASAAQRLGYEHSQLCSQLTSIPAQLEASPPLA